MAHSWAISWCGCCGAGLGDGFAESCGGDLEWAVLCAVLEVGGGVVVESCACWVVCGDGVDCGGAVVGGGGRDGGGGESGEIAVAVGVGDGDLEVGRLRLMLASWTMSRLMFCGFCVPVFGLLDADMLDRLWVKLVREAEKVERLADMVRGVESWSMAGYCERCRLRAAVMEARCCVMMESCVVVLEIALCM